MKLNYYNKSAELNTVDFKSYLTRCWRENKKWLLYPVEKKRLKVYELIFEENIDKANFVCSKLKACYGHWKFKPLIDVLRCLNLHLKFQEKRDCLNVIHTQLSQYPIEEIKGSMKLVSTLCSGEVSVGFWKKLINPFSEIIMYHTIEISIDEKVSKRFMSSDITYKKAVKSFHSIVTTKETSSQFSDIKYLFIGQIKADLLLSKMGMPLHNTGILLMTTLDTGRIGQQKDYFTQVVNDISSPFDIRIPILIRYSLERKVLEFLDGDLHKIKAGTNSNYFDVKYFSFENSSLIINKLQND